MPSIAAAIRRAVTAHPLFLPSEEASDALKLCKLSSFAIKEKLAYRIFRVKASRAPRYGCCNRCRRSPAK
jgi:hypothetical protein